MKSVRLRDATEAETDGRTGRTTMGYRGPIPKPSAIARAEGNPGKRRLNDCEPQPRATTPRCPDHLDAEAKKEWKRLVPVLRRMRVLTEADWMTLANPVPDLVHDGESAEKTDRKW